MISAISPVPVRMPVEVRDWLKAKAAANLRSLNSEIVALLLQAKRDDEEKKEGFPIAERE